MINKMINMRNKGKKYTEIASALDISTSTLSKYLKQNRDKLDEYNEL